MPKKSPGSSVKDKRLYEALRDEGLSKKKSARIANAASQTSRQTVSKRGGRAGPYDTWTVAELRAQAKKVGIKGRSTMSKKQLISALRHS